MREMLVAVFVFLASAAKEFEEWIFRRRKE